MIKSKITAEKKLARYFELQTQKAVIDAEMKGIKAELKSFAESKKAEPLFDGNTARLENGALCWKNTPPKVQFGSPNKIMLDELFGTYPEMFDLSKAIKLSQLRPYLENADIKTELQECGILGIKDGRTFDIKK